MRLLLLLFTSLLFMPHLHADSFSMDFVIAGSGISSAGTLLLSSTSDPNVSRVTGISGYFQSAAAGVSGTITGMNAASYSAANPTNDGGFVYDNLFYKSGAAATCFGTASSGAAVDNCGIDFFVGNLEVNLFYQPGMGFIIADAPINSNQSYYDNSVVSFTAAQTPEPAGVWSMLTGIGALTCYGWKYRRTLLRQAATASFA